jgi:hypothetical protein
MSNSGIHVPLICAGIKQLDVIPNSPPTREVALTVENLIATKTRNRNPRAATPLIGDLLSIPESHHVHLSGK